MIIDAATDFLLDRKAHPDYRLMQYELKKIRDCIEGSSAVKRETYLYLPHPSQIDKDSKEQQIRYAEYLSGAEFDSDSDDLRRSLLGKMRISSTTIELPPGVEYLEQNADGDGMPLAAAIEYATNNVLQTKWHLLVVDYKGAPADGAVLSAAEKKELNPHAEIKQYTRENVINWEFSRKNGVMQLSWIKLLELTYELDPATEDRKRVESYLILGLDDNGDYYQQKIVRKQGEIGETGAIIPVKVGAAPLKWIPIVILADEELPNNSLPRQLGYLDRACNAQLYRYRVSAVYKETQRNLAPTTYTSGWKSGDMDIFTQANGGRSYVATGAGAVNNLPDGVTVSIESTSAEMTDFQWYFKNSQDKVMQMGGRGSAEAGNMTATEANILAADQNALLETIADNCEQGFKRAVSYCAMLEGLWAPDAVESSLDQITIELPRDFATPKITVEERQQSTNEYMAGLISKAEAQRQLEQGGATVESIEVINSEIEAEPPRVSTNTATNLTDNAV